MLAVAFFTAVIFLLTMVVKSKNVQGQPSATSPRVEIKADGVSTTGLIWESLSRQFISTVSAY